MSEFEIFTAALQITDVSERVKYLDDALGTDEERRRRIEVLLQNHKGAGGFMANPVDARLAAFCAGPDDTPSDLHNDEEAERVIDFLEPSTKPGALGRLGHYEVLEVLGQGGFGTVVKAFDEKLHRMVAIKVMSPRLAVTSPARKRFVREARASAAIRHENVVGIHAIEEKPIPFLVMEFVAGETLQERIDRTGPLELPDILRIGVQIANGLAAAHAMGRIHRDIKPANILLESGSGDLVKITDFGLARAADDASVTQSGVIAGTPLYMAPEQAQGLVVDHRADLFSLGSVLYVVCTGRPPFRAANALAVLKRVTDETPRPIREIIPEAPARLCDVISKLHAKNPDERFQSAAEVADLLGRYLAEVHSGALAPESKQDGERMTPPTRRKSRWLLVTAGLVGMISVGLALSEATGVTNLHATILRAPAGSGKLPDVDKPPEVVPVVGAEPDRRGAQYVLTMGGTVHVNDQVRPLRASDELPIGPFRLTNLDLANKRVSENGLVYLKGCRHLRQLELTNSNVTDEALANFKDCTDLNALGLSGTKVSDAGLAHFQNCKRLARIDLHGTTISNDGLAYFKGCKDLGLIAMPRTAVSDDGLIHLKESKNLSTLELSDTKVGDTGLTHLRSCKRLRTLGLAGTRVSDAGLELLAGFPELTHVNLEKTKVSRAALRQLSFRLPTCTIQWDGGVMQVTASSEPDRRGAEYTLALGGEINIKEGRGKKPGNFTQRNVQNLEDLPLGVFGLRMVDLSQNTHVGDTGLALFQDCKELEALALEGAKVSDGGMAAFRDCMLLRALDLDRAPIGDEGLAHFRNHRNLIGLGLTATRVTDLGLGYFKDCEHLTRLDIAETRVSDAGLAIFKDRKSFIQIDLSGTEIGDDGVAHLQRSQNLVTLRLGRTKVSDTGLAHLKDHKVLATLELHQTQFSDLGLLHLKNCKELMHLNLAGTQVSDAGLVHLAGFTKLLWLNVKNTKVSEVGAKGFAASLPTCKVIWTGGVIEPTIEADPNRRAKEWLLSKPGHLDRCAFVEDTEIRVSRLEGFPKVPYELRGHMSSRSSGIPNESLKILKLNKIPHLTHLFITNRQVGDNDLVLLREHVHLKELHLSLTAVTDAGLAKLTVFPNLRYLNLKKTAVTEAAVTKFAAALPGCKVEWNGGVLGP